MLFPFAMRDRRQGQLERRTSSSTRGSASRVNVDARRRALRRSRRPARSPSAAADAAAQPARGRARAAPTRAARRRRPPRSAPLVDDASIPKPPPGLGARNIGSAAMSGRVTSLAAVHEGDRLTVYVGAASGGVWKSINGGTTFKPVFDKQDVQSIGALAIDPTDPKTVWVGHRRSVDAQLASRSATASTSRPTAARRGRTWGSRSPSTSSKILVDPIEHEHRLRVRARASCSATATTAACTRPPTAARRWTKVLAGANASTGCSLMTMDPSSPRTLYAGMWDFRRKGWTFRSGGDGPDAPSGSGMFKSTDGGATWTALDEKSGEGAAGQAVGPRRGRPSRRRSRTSSTRSSRRCRRSTASTAPTTAARRGNCATAARTCSGVRSTSRTSSSIRRTRTASTSPTARSS